jgi:hypothetical protein
MKILSAWNDRYDSLLGFFFLATIASPTMVWRAAARYGVAEPEARATHDSVDPPLDCDAIAMGRD